MATAAETAVVQTAEPVTKGKPVPAANGKPVLYRKAESGEYVPLESDASTTTTMENADSPDEEALGGLPDRPVGAIVSEGLFDRLMELAEFIETAGSRQENERLASILDELAGSVSGHAETVSSFHGAEYPDQDPLQKSEDLDDETDKEGADEEPYSEEEEEPGGKGRKGRKRLTPNVATLAERVARVKKWRASRPEAVTKRMSRGAAKVCTKAAAYLGEISEHEGELRESHKSAAAHHKTQLEQAVSREGGMAAPYSEEDDEMKSLRAENEKVRGALKTLLGQHERLVKAFRRAQRGR
jgi:hypothetical protein